MANRINFEVGYTVDKTSLSEIKSSLLDIQRLTAKDLLKIDKNSDLATARKNLNEIRQSASQVEQALDRAFNVNLGTLNVAKFNKELQNIGIENIYASFSKAGAAGQNAFRNITTEILTTNTQLKQSHSLIDNMATTLANTVKWNIASSAVNNLSGSIQKAYYYVKDLDRSLNDIRIVTGNSAEEMANFAVQANTAAKSLASGTVDYTNAALIYYQQGLSEEEVKARTDITLKTANVTQQNTAEVSEQLTAVWNGYKVSAEEAELYVDKMAAVAATTASDLEELSVGMSKVASAANAMGVDMDQLNAQIATIISVTRQAPESVGTALKTIYARMGDLDVDGMDEFGVTLGDVSSQMADMGIQILDQNGELRDMGTIIEEVAAKWGTWSKAQQTAAAQAMAGTRQYNNLVALFDNWDMYTESLDTSRNALGTLQEQQDIYLDSTQAHLKQMSAAFEDLYDSILDSDSINFVVDDITLIINKLADFTDAIGGGKGALLGLGSIALSVFDKQIAQSISTTITNLKISFDNLKKSWAETQINKEFGKLNIPTEGINELVNMKKEVSDLNKVLSSEEKDIANDLIKQTAELYNQKEAWTENLKTATDYINKIDEDLNIESLKGITQEDTKYEEIIDALEREQTQIQRTSKELQEYQRTIDATSQAMHEYGQASTSTLSTQEQVTNAEEAQSAALANLKVDMESCVKEAEALANSQRISAPMIQQLTRATKAYNQALSEGADEVDLTNAAQRVVIAYRRANEELEQEASKTLQVVQNEVNGMSQNIETGLKGIKEKFNNFLSGPKLKDGIKGIIDLTSALGGLTFSIKNVAHLGEIINDKDLSTVEKATEVITGLGMSLPMLISSTLNAVNAMKSLSNVTGIAMGPMGLFIGVLGVGVTALAAYKDAIDAKRKADKEAVKQQQEIFEQTREEIENNKGLYQEYINLLSTYKSTGEGKDELNQKTKELCASLGMEASALDLLSGKYDNYTKTMLENQKVSIEEGIQQAKDLQEGQLGLFSSDVLSTQYESGLDDMGIWSDFIDTGKLQLNLDVGINWDTEDEEKFVDVLQPLIESKEELEGLDLSGLLNGEIKNITKEQLPALYETFQDAKIKIQSLYADNTDVFTKSEVFLGMEKFLSDNKEYYESIIEAKQALEEYSTQLADIETQLAAEDIDLASIVNIDQFEQVRANFIEQLKEIFGNDKTAEEIEALADAYLGQYENLSDFVETKSIENELRELLSGSEEEIEKFIQSLQDEDKMELLGHIYIDKGETVEQVKEAMNIAQKQLDLENLTAHATVVSQASETIESKGTLSGYSKDDTEAFNDAMSSIQGIYDQSKTALEEWNTIQYESKEQQLKYLDEVAFAQFMNAAARRDSERELAESIKANETNIKDTLEAAQLENATKIKEYLQETGKTEAELKAEGDETYAALIADADNYEEAIDRHNKTLEDAKSKIDSLDQSYATGIDPERIEYIQKEVDSLDMLHEGYANGIVTAQEYEKTQDDIINKELESLDVSKEVFDDYVDNLKDISKNLANDEKAAKRVAMANIKMNKGIEELSDNFEDNLKVLEDSQEGSYDYAEAMSSIKDSLEDVFGFRVSDDFIKDHLNEIQNLAEGDISALEQLRIAAAQDYVATLRTETDEPETIAQLNTLDSLIANFSLDDIEIGASIDDTNFINTLNEMLANSQITATDAQNILNSLGYDPQIDMVPGESTQHTGGSGTVNVGLLEFPYSFDSTVTSDVMVPRISPKGTVFRGGAPAVSRANKTPASSGGGKKGGGGGGKKGKSPKSEKAKDPEQEDLLEDEADRYHDINIEIEQINQQLDDLEKIQNKLTGKNLIKNLEKQLDLLEKQKNKYKEKIELEKMELGELQRSLKSQGVTFNADGTISNYAAALQAKLNATNKIIAKYNKMSAEEQEKYKQTMEDAKESYEKFKEQIERYDEVLVNEIPELENQIQEATDKQIEIQIDKFNIKAEVALETGDAEREWNEFKKKIVNGIKDDDILGNAKAALVDIGSYYKEGFEGEIQVLTQHVNDTLDQLRQIDQYGTSSVYGDNKAQALEDLKNYYQEVMEQLEDVQDLQDEIQEAYLDMIDEVVDAFNDHVEQYEYISDLIEHDMNVINLLRGEDAYAEMANYYEQQEKNNLNTLDFQRKQVDLLKKRMDAEEKGSKAWEAYKEAWEDAQKELNDTIEKSIETLIDKYTNAVNKIFKDLGDKVTGGLGLDYVSEEWDLINDNADRYLDTINSMYAIQSLENKYLDAINDTDNLADQQKLNQLMNEQLDMLKTKDKLTQYDVDRANALYDIALKEIALQNAQQNKSKLRLRRDSQGNYSYQYVSDEDAIAQGQQELADAQNSLYNMDKNQYKENLNDMYDIYSEFQEKLKELYLDTTLSAEERELKEKLLTEQYQELINGITEENLVIRNNLYNSAFTDLANLYDVDISNFQNMAQEEQDILMTSLIPQWESGVQAMIDKIVAEGGLLPTCQDAFDEIAIKNGDYSNSLDELAEKAGIDFNTIVTEGYDPLIEKIQETMSGNDEIINQYNDQLDAMQLILDQLDNMIAKYDQARTAAINASQAAYEYAQQQAKEEAKAAKQTAADQAESTSVVSPSTTPSTDTSKTTDKKKTTTTTKDSEKKKDTKKSSSGGDGVPKVGDMVTYVKGRYYNDSYGGGPSGNRGVGKKAKITIINSGAPYPYHLYSTDSAYGWVKKDQISGYDTGGYTGEWNSSDGKLGFLHEKELVLNKEDTENILSAVKVVKNMDNVLQALNSVLFNRINGLLEGMNFNGLSYAGANSVVQQDVNIQANFPSVHSAKEIEEAINNLVNVASQHAFNTLK